MTDNVRLGVAGLTHGHVWGIIDNWKKIPGVELVAVADASEVLPKAIGFAHQYTDWREMLAKHVFDVLIVTSDNVESTEIAITALEKGIPCFVEKAMAASGADADRMLAAQAKKGALLMINWPLAWNAWVYELKRQMDAGAVGNVFHLKFRIGHHGPKEIGCGPEFYGWLYDESKNGGGAIADFGGYGAALALFLLGKPESVYCIRGNFTKDYPVPDDHAIIVLRYPKGSAVLEGTWATFGWDESANPVVHGAKGTLAVYGNQLKKHVAGAEAEEVAITALEHSSPAEYFLHCLRSGKAPAGILNPTLSADACRIIDAAKEANRTGVEQKLW